MWFKIKYLDLKYENIVCISVMSGQNLIGVTQNPMLHCDKIGWLTILKLQSRGIFMDGGQFQSPWNLGKF